MNYLMHLVVIYCIAAVLALSVNLIVGYCGLVTLAHATFFAIGAYSFAVATTAWGLPFEAALGLSVGITMFAGTTLAATANRFKGDQFLLMSLVVQVLVFSLIRNWGSSGAPIGSWSNLTNGPYGISAVPRPVIVGVPFGADWVRCLGALLMLLIVAGVCWLVLSSPFGRLLKAIRDDEWATRSLGKNASAARRQAFLIAGGFAGLAGVYYALHLTYVDPSIAALDESVLILSMIIIGGPGNKLLGPLCGALLFVGVPELLRLIDVRVVDPSNARLLVFGVLLVLLIHLRPQGVAGALRMDRTHG